MNTKLLLQAIDNVLADGVLPVGAQADTSAFGRAAERSRYQRAAQGTSGTGRPIPETYGAAHDSATRAAVGGGPKPGGGGMSLGDQRLRATASRAEFGASLGITAAATMLTTSLNVAIRWAVLCYEDRKAARAG